MTARKIRDTAVGPLAMPVDCDETTLTAEDLARDDVCTAWTEVQRHMPDEPDEDWAAALDWASGDDLFRMRHHLLKIQLPIVKAWLDRRMAAANAGPPFPQVEPRPVTAACALLAMLPENL